MRRFWGEKDLNLRRREPTDLQSAPFDHSGISPNRAIKNPRAISRNRTGDPEITSHVLCQLS